MSRISIYVILVDEIKRTQKLFFFLIYLNYLILNIIILMAVIQAKCWVVSRLGKTANMSTFGFLDKYIIRSELNMIYPWEMDIPSGWFRCFAVSMIFNLDLNIKMKLKFCYGQKLMASDHSRVDYPKDMVIPSGRELRSFALWIIFNFDLISKSCFSKLIPIFVTIAFLASSNDLYFFQNI